MRKQKLKRQLAPVKKFFQIARYIPTTLGRGDQVKFPGKIILLSGKNYCYTLFFGEHKPIMMRQLPENGKQTNTAKV